MKKIKSENQILIMLAFFSISMGLWENFRQLWLQDNGFSATNISNIISIGTLISVLGIIIVGKYIRLDKLKTFVSYSLFIKFLNLLILLNLNNTQKLFFINISIIIDVLTSYLITTSIYPLITTIIKNNTIYSKRKLTEYLFKDVGVLIGGLLIGKEVLGFLINYNICLFVSIIFLGIAIIVMFNMTPVCKQDEKNRTPILRYIMKDKIQVIYMIYTLIGATAYSTALGLKMLTFTNYLNFTDSTATSYLLIIGLIADGIGILALKYLTPKNDYITITIKFGIRFIAYAIAFMANNVMVSLAAITWSILISTSYENICDGYYINGIKNEYQFRYTNLRYIIRYLGEAVGVFLCGMMYEIGLRYMLGLSAVFILFQLGLAYYLIYLRNNKNELKFKMEYKFNLKDFKNMEDIEHSYFPNDNITPAEEVARWYRKNNLTCVGVRNENNEIIASVSILPLDRNTFMNIYENKMNEADVLAEQIEEYHDNKPYYIYLSSISIDKKYRNNYKVITTLLKGCIDLFDSLRSRNIKIEKVMADASTIHGEKICNKLLKMNYITDTSHKSKIYCEDGENFIEAINKMKKYLGE